MISTKAIRLFGALLLVVTLGCKKSTKKPEEKTAPAPTSLKKTTEAPPTNSPTPVKQPLTAPKGKQPSLSKGLSDNLNLGTNTTPTNLSISLTGLNIPLPNINKRPQPNTQQPPTNQPPTQQPPTNQPPTQQPPTDQQPPVQQPPTQQPPTQQPPTQQPPTQQPPTDQQPPTNQPHDNNRPEEGQSPAQNGPNDHQQQRPHQQTPTGTSVYTTPDGRVSVKYPNGWSPTYSNNVVTVTKVPGNQGMGMLQLVSQVTQQPLSIDEAYGRIISALQRGFGDFTVLEKRPSSDNKPFAAFVASYTSQGQPYKALGVVFIKGTTVTFAHYTSLTSVFNRAEAVRLLKPVVSGN